MIGTQAVTHAVAQSGVEFAKLGLVVIDEQHRFGVRQRAALKKAGVDPHYLVMTATPIPRTVGMTLFGDLDVSTLRESPPGRQKVNTYLANDLQRQKWWQFFRKQLDSGRQAYVIAPLVEESESVDAANVQETYDALARGELAGYRLGLLHGRMTPAEKDSVMQAFHAGRTKRAHFHERGRGGRRCAQCHADDDRRGRAVSAWPSSTSFAAASAAAVIRAICASSPIRSPTNRRSG